MATGFACPSCGGAGVYPGAEKGGVLRCRHCGATAYLPDGTTIRVQGHSAQEVERVFREATKDAHERSMSRHVSPWVSGSFYLLALLLVLATLAVIANVVPIWILPAVIVGGLLGLSLIGTLQLRQDRRLSEEGFLRLIWLTLRQLPTGKVSFVQPLKNTPTGRNTHIAGALDAALMGDLHIITGG